jgi:uncharacterized protein YeaO (DUF488 family)
VVSFKATRLTATDLVGGSLCDWHALWRTLGGPPERICLMSVKVKRAYDRPSSDDGYRVLVDRLWPRGISKADAKLDDWLKSIAPSDELRKWFHRDRSRWGEFRMRYLSELKDHREVLRPLAKKAEKGRVTLVYSANDEEHNNAVVLKQYLKMLDAA